MASEYEIRASFDRRSIVVYQAYGPEIAEAAVKAQRLVEPFSLQRMTWIKPSFLWLMHRSNWGAKKGQERTLAVTISRAGWDEALSNAVLTVYDARAFRSKEDWDNQFRSAAVYVQWDPERTLRGAALGYYSIQIGLSRAVIGQYVNEWTVKIEDLSTQVAKMRQLLRSGQVNEAKRYLPKEQVYPVSASTARQLLIHGGL